MSIQWMLAAGFLYVEIVVVLLLIFPIFSPKRYNSFFKSNAVRVLSNQAAWYFGFVLLVLALLFVDAIREMRKYSHTEHLESQLPAELQHNMRLFRAQRNFYISGFAMFLSLVIRQLIQLISKQATLLAENEAVLKQAKSATATARNLMGTGESAQNTSNEKHQKEIEKLTKELDSAKKELTKSLKDKEALVSQSKSLETEYDRLQEEHRKLQLKVKVAGGDKKDE